MQFTHRINKEKDMLALGILLSKLCQKGDIIYLQGELGAGKTTLTRGILRAFGYTDIVKSPTYTLVESYSFTEFSLYHFDLYRVSDPNELLHIGLEDYFNEESICIIEWPENGNHYLPKATLICQIDIINDQREVRLFGFTKRGRQIVKQLIANKAL